MAHSGDRYAAADDLERQTKYWDDHDWDDMICISSPNKRATEKYGASHGIDGS